MKQNRKIRIAAACIFAPFSGTVAAAPVFIGTTDTVSFQGALVFSFVFYPIIITVFLLAALSILLKADTDVAAAKISTYIKRALWVSGLFAFFPLFMFIMLASAEEEPVITELFLRGFFFILCAALSTAIIAWLIMFIGTKKK